jgi:hypothetical protein
MPTLRRLASFPPFWVMTRDGGVHKRILVASRERLLRSIVELVVDETSSSYRRVGSRLDLHRPGICKCIEWILVLLV